VVVRSVIIMSGADRDGARSLRRINVGYDWEIAEVYWRRQNGVYSWAPIRLFGRAPLAAGHSVPYWAAFNQVPIMAAQTLMADRRLAVWIEGERNTLQIQGKRSDEAKSSSPRRGRIGSESENE